ncbi:substrate-binding periplasmic protein [Simplicispira hankyongi]|uniref:ABC transporter substrate-binding protein n=1 Tax=Simplicispira hankyongi TaxID=2315688 RepID=A0A398CAZ8_9BURK|nr:transporter substrate-binding domain-containing protein [Simplicispira hankyongi]RID97510.1 ABC transporter substrate-binding protein [Simplicispira hankyongi]
MPHCVLLFWMLIVGTAAVQAQTIEAVTETTPYTYVANGKVVGTATEVVEQTLQRAGLTEYSVHLYPWARAYDMALKEANVLIFLIARTPARERQFQWAGEIMKIQYHLYRLKSHPLDIGTLEAAKAYTIGVMRDDVRQQYLRAKGFERLVVSAQSLDNFRKLLRGQVDLVPLTTDDAASLCQQTGFDCANLVRVLTLDEASTGLYMAYSLQTPLDVVHRTQAAFDQLKSQGQVQRTMERTP